MYSVCYQLYKSLFLIVIAAESSASPSVFLAVTLYSPVSDIPASFTVRNSFNSFSFPLTDFISIRWLSLMTFPSLNLVKYIHDRILQFKSVLRLFQYHRGSTRPTSAKTINQAVSA